MQFLVTGRDGTDEGALERRLKTRDAHIAMCDTLFNQKKLLFGVALLDDNEKMVGSNMVFDVESREELDALLAVEPYVTGNVWETIDIQPCRLGPTFSVLFES
jgi:uncharacterized protein YciI